MTRLEEARQAAKVHEKKDRLLAVHIVEGPRVVVVTVEKKTLPWHHDLQTTRIIERAKIEKAAFNLLRAEVDDMVERIEKL